MSKFLTTIFRKLFSMFAQCMQVVEHHEDLLQQATGIETLEGQFLGMTLHLHDNYNFHEQRKNINNSI